MTMQAEPSPDPTTAMPPVADFGADGGLVLAAKAGGSGAAQHIGRGLHMRAVPDPESMHHTILPRTMVIAGLLAALGSPLFFLVLHQQDHFDIVGNDWIFDEHGRRLAKAAVTAIVACFLLGWLWWATVAALNARRRARYAVSPWLASITALLTVGCVALLPAVVDRLQDNEEDTGLLTMFCVLMVVPVVSFFGTLSSYRRSAGGIGASQRPWNVVIVLPWVLVAVNLLAQFFSNAVGDNFLMVMGVVNMAFLGAMVLGLYRGMAAFDRACAGSHMAHTDRAELPDFLRRK